MGLFRKKNSQPPVSARPPVPRTLSLPDLHDSPSGELSVPSAWLDPSVKDSYHQPATVGPSFSLNGHGPPGGAGTPKSSFSAIRTGFHRPFRGAAPSVASPSVSSFAAPGSMYGMKRGAGSVRTKGKKLVSTLEDVRGGGRAGGERTGTPTPFNLCVVGASGTGKSSLLRLILQTLDLSPTVDQDVRDKVGSFGTTAAREDWTLSVEVKSPVSRSDRFLLTVVDTPGLPFGPGRELELDRGVSALVRELEGRLGETLREENKVIRTTKGDDHIHLLLYLIDPMSILTSGSPPPSTSGYVPATPALPLLPSPLLPYLKDGDSSAPPSASTLGPSRLAPVPIESTLHLPAAQIKALRRLATRTNILPVLTKTDLLTSKQLSLVRAVVRRDLAGIDLGEAMLSLGDPDEDKEDLGESGDSGRATPTRASDGRLNHQNLTPPGSSEPKKVIRLRSSRSNSKLRGPGKGVAPPSPAPSTPGTAEQEDGGNREKRVVLPLALVAPEDDDEYDGGVGRADGGGGERRFVREYPWGTLSVLDSNHSDFVPFQQALFSSVDHLKQTTREVVFEKFRMEKLLIRRATQTLPESERQKMMGRLS